MINNKDIKILIADDSVFMRKYIIGFLHEAGFEKVVEAGNGKLAVEEFNKEKPDIVLLDLIMPVETGTQALAELVKLGGKVIVISAVGQQPIIDNAIKTGAKGYFIKPFFTAPEISSKISAILS